MSTQLVLHALLRRDVGEAVLDQKMHVEFTGGIYQGSNPTWEAVLSSTCMFHAILLAFETTQIFWPHPTPVLINTLPLSI